MILVWFFISGIAYTFREIPHIWNRSTTYKLRFYLPDWIITTDKKLNWFHKLTFQFFTNGYHFFGNLSRLLLPPILILDVIYHPYIITLSIPELIIASVVCYMLWYIGRKLTFWIFITKA